MFGAPPETTQAGGRTRLYAIAALVLLLLLQVGISFHGIANYWQWGHNGFNGAAYEQAARNSLRWGLLFPAQYASGDHYPGPGELYAHAPLALHLHVVASMRLLGDHEWVVRLVPALQGILSTLVFFLVVRAFYGFTHGLLALGIYILLPINHIFANMVNHSMGFICWALVMLGCYLRASSVGTPPPGRSVYCLGLLAATLLATSWDWPAYYIAFVIFGHWVCTSDDPLVQRIASRTVTPLIHRITRRRADREGSATFAATTPPGIRWLVLFCLLVLGQFVGFFALAHQALGTFHELGQSFSVRMSVPGNAGIMLGKHFLTMYPLPLLLLSLFWLGSRVALLVRHTPLAPRDLIPLSFLFAGLLHMVLFLNTASIHIYWIWPLSPLVAIASAQVLLDLPTMALRPRTRRVLLGLALGLSLVQTIPLFVEGRRLAGTFFYPKKYDSEQEKVLFARQVREWTTLHTGVYVHPALSRRVEFGATIDRVQFPSDRPLPVVVPPSRQADGWVFIGPAGALADRERVQAAATYPFRQFGAYVFIDFRHPATDIQIWRLRPEQPTLSWRYLVNLLEPPLRAERDPQAEQELRQQVQRGRLPAKP